MSQGGDGIHHLSWRVTVAENLSMGVNQGNYYVLGGYEKFFLHRGVFLFTGIAQYAVVALSPVQSQMLDVASDSVDHAADAPLSHVQSQLVTCAAGYQRAAVDAPLSHV